MDSEGSIRESRYQYLFDSFTGLIAVFHALHRLLALDIPHMPLVAWPH